MKNNTNQIDINHQQALYLHTACNLGNYTIGKLLKHFKNLANIFKADDEVLKKVFSSKQFISFKNNTFDFTNYWPKHQAFLAQSGNYFITCDDPRYPPTLKQTDDPPVFLYIRGDLGILEQPAIAIVGSRNADDYGLAQTKFFAEGLANAGFCIVSGFAQGVDGMAHLSAIQAGQNTIAVLGAGMEIDYPKAHQQLRQQLNLENSCIISEFLLDASPLEYHFPRRNRTIAALAAGVLVTQAQLKSGSLITARLANELGRDVFAVPHHLNTSGQGCNHLIQQGAKLVFSIECITEEYYYLLQNRNFRKLGLYLNNINNINNISDNLNNNVDNNLDSNLIFENKNINNKENNYNNNDKFENLNPLQKYIIAQLKSGKKHLDEILINPNDITKHNLEDTSLDIQTELFMLELDNYVLRSDGGFYELLN